RGEDWIARAVLAAIVAIPLAEALLRRFGTGIAGAPLFVQHLVLVLSMLGAALAAREKRLLALSQLHDRLPGALKSIASVLAAAMAAAIAVVLARAGLQLVQSEREAAAVLGYGVPKWLFQSTLPIGYALIALRAVWCAGSTWSTRGAAALATAALLAVALRGPWTPEQLQTPALVLLGAATLLGAPIFATLGGAALILFWAQDTPVVTLSIEHNRLVTQSLLPTLPMFTLAGYLLAEGGASRRLVRVFDALFGALPGGSAIATTCVCAFFTTFTGASGVTILALGGLLLPVLIGAGYRERQGLGLLVGAGSLGMLFPPCTPIILYATVAYLNGSTSISVERLYAGALLPGIALLVLTAAWGVAIAPRGAGARRRFAAAEAGRALWAAKFELLVPVVALVAWRYSTLVEAAALTALYALLVGTVLNRDVSITKDVPRVLSECALLIGGVLLILGVALGLTSWLVDAQIPDQAVEWVRAHVHTQTQFLIALTLFLLVVGCLMDVYSAIFVVVPILVPIGAAFDVDPVHLGVLFLANLELGFLTPPVGMNLFLASYRFKKPMSEVVRASLPMLVVLLVGVLAITFVPWLSTWLPSRMAQ
ncbi:MAG: TRAP transporter large permease subunit, partial [Planctomycetota bacterium]